MPSLINAVPLVEPASGDVAPAGGSFLNRSAALVAPPTQADAWDANSQAYGDFVARERASGVAAGLVDPETGWPTKAGLEDAAHQLAQSILMGTTAPGVKGSAAGVAHPNYAEGSALPPTVYRGSVPGGANEQRSTMASGGVYVSSNPEAAGQWGEATAYPVHTQPNLLDLGNWNGPAKATVARYLGIRPGQLSRSEFSEGAADMFIKNEGTERLQKAGYDGYRLGQDAYLLGDLGNYAGAAPAAGIINAPDPGFNVFHGSPHSFDAFDASKIGTGEGAQAYGHGLYFADNEGVARSYRDDLVRTTFSPEPGAPGLDAEAFGGHLRDITHETHDLTAGQLGSVDMVAGLVARDMEQGLSVPELRKWVDAKITDPNTKAAYHAVLDNAADVHVNPGWATVGGQRFDGSNSTHGLAAEIFDANGATGEILSRLQASHDALRDHVPSEWDMGIWAKENTAQRVKTMADIQAGLAAVKAGTVPAYEPPGHMYEVRVNADPAHFLDWDKPLSEQTPHVQAALQRAGMTPPAMRLEQLPDGAWSATFPGDRERVFATRAEADAFAGHFGPNPTGREILQARLPGGGGQEAAATALKAAGIPGVRYLDGGSRGVGQGTSNHVVFSPETISILRKYGIAGLTAGGTAAAAQDQ